MKLNNKGWGLKEMIFLVLALLLFLGIIVYLIVVMQTKDDKPLKESLPFIQRNF